MQNPSKFALKACSRIFLTVHSQHWNIFNTLLRTIYIYHLWYYIIQRTVTSFIFWSLEIWSVFFSLLSAGCSWDFMLHRSLRFHHIRRLWPLLWRHLHADSCRHNHSSGDSALYHRLDRVLCNNTWKLMWSCNCECGLIAETCGVYCLWTRTHNQSQIIILIFCY